MTFQKMKLANADMGYSVASMNILGKERIVAASEGKGPALILNEHGSEEKVISSTPGGCMGFADFPGRDDALFMITGFYPVFQAEKAGIDLCMSENGLEEWSQKRIVNLPFVHRISTVQTAVGNYLFAATVCGGKQFQDDWSSPGALYVIEIPESPDGSWKAIPIIEGLHRNHGMALGTMHGKKTLLISADEGVFAVPVPETRGENWKYDRILNHPVSEIGLIDLNKDGIDELVTIEPFHGETLGVYKRIKNKWTMIDKAALSFGHGLTTGELNGNSVVIAGNRAGEKNLVCFSMNSRGPERLQEFVIDHGSGSAGTAIIRSGKGDAIIASNPALEEYALYTAPA